MFSKFFGLGKIFNFNGLKESFGEVDLKGLMKGLHEDETGQGMTEYIIIIVLVAILVLAVVKLFGKKIKDLFQGSTNKLQEAGSDAGVNN